MNLEDDFYRGGGRSTSGELWHLSHSAKKITESGSYWQWVFYVIIEYKAKPVQTSSVWARHPIQASERVLRALAHLQPISNASEIWYILSVDFFIDTVTRGTNPVTWTQWRGMRGEHALAGSQVVGTTQLRLEGGGKPNQHLWGMWR